MIELLRSGAALTLPLLPHLLRVLAGGSARQAPSPLPLPGPAAAAAAPDSPSYSLSEEEGEEDVHAASAAAAAADGLLESPLVQAERTSQRFGLNQEQAEVLQYVAAWAAIGAGGGTGGSASKRRGSSGMAAGAGQPPPVCLVHGPFGSGGGWWEG